MYPSVIYLILEVTDETSVITWLKLSCAEWCSEGSSTGVDLCVDFNGVFDLILTYEFLGSPI